MKRDCPVAFVIPCFNEAITITQVIADCRRVWPSAEVYVFDNNSTDETAALARQAGATVVHSPKQGKGEVVRHAFSILNQDILVILDGDGTYSAEAAVPMIRAIHEEECDMVVCNRRAKSSASYPKFHRFGNWLFTTFVSLLLHRRVGDVFSGYRAVSRDFYETIVLDSKGFEIESELTLKAFINGFTVKETFGAYGNRPAGSHSKLKTFPDGWRILKFVMSLMRDFRPVLFFGSLSSVCFLLALWSGSAPVMDFMKFQYVYTVPRAVLAASLMVLSLLLFGVGIILDSQNRHFRNQMVLMRRLIKRTRPSMEATTSSRSKAHPRIRAAG